MGRKAKRSKGGAHGLRVRICDVGQANRIFLRLSSGIRIDGLRCGQNQMREAGANRTKEG